MYTCIENLSTELWFIIFRFLTCEHLISAFSKLNSRFDSLLASLHLPIIFRVKIGQYDAYPTIQSVRSSKNLKFEWIQALEAYKHVSGGCLVQFLRYQTPRLINLRLLSVSIRAKGASANLNYLSKALSQLYSLQIFKLRLTRISPIRFSPTGLSSMAKVQSTFANILSGLSSIGESPLDFRQEHSRLSPIGE
jgi:hypothetical protein